MVQFHHHGMFTNIMEHKKKRTYRRVQGKSHSGRHMILLVMNKGLRHVMCSLLAIVRCRDIICASLKIYKI